MIRAAKNTFKGGRIDETIVEYESNFNMLKSRFIEGEITDIKVLSCCMYDMLEDLSEYCILRKVAF